MCGKRNEDRRLKTVNILKTKLFEFTSMIVSLFFYNCKVLKVKILVTLEFKSLLLPLIVSSLH